MYDWGEMNKFIIMIPVYNDWESLKKLLHEINNSINGLQNVKFECVIINDASTEIVPKINVPSSINSIDIINMKKNKGHARCNAFGIRYFAKISDYNYLILMDADGEDRPEEIKLLVNKILLEKNVSVVAKRIKRSEGLFFQSLYQLHKLITIIFTGKNINFGNYSCLTKADVDILSQKESLWSTFSGSLKKHIFKLNSINSIRGTRYFGPSKMSLFKLVIHSFSIIAAFKNTVFIRSAILIIISSFFSKIGSPIIFFQIFLVLFNLMIYLVSLRENKKEFLESGFNKGEKKRYTH